MTDQPRQPEAVCQRCGKAAPIAAEFVSTTDLYGPRIRIRVCAGCERILSALDATDRDQVIYALEAHRKACA